MAQINVKKTSLKGRFVLSWTEVAQSSLILDFTPFIEYFNLPKDARLLHWQARPKGVRTWGIYTLSSDTYKCIEGEVNDIPCRNPIRLLQLDENFISSVPTAVILL